MEKRIYSTTNSLETIQLRIQQKRKTRENMFRPIISKNNRGKMLCGIFLLPSQREIYQKKLMTIPCMPIFEKYHETKRQE